MKLEQLIKEKAYELGFSRIGITSVEPFVLQSQALEERKKYYTFFNDGIALKVGCDPKKVMPQAKSIISLAYDFSSYQYPEKLLKYFGRVYLSRAYNPRKNTEHWLRLQQFKDFLNTHNIQVAESRITVSDREAAVRSGVASFGRNNFAFMNGGSSFVQLYTFIVDTELEIDHSTSELRCPPNCRLCIDHCPTKALYGPNQLNPLTCITYLNCFTQDNMHPTTNSFIPVELRPLLQSKIHGCDVCQEVCPRNKGALLKATKKDEFIEQLSINFELEKVLLMDDDYYERIIKPISYNYIKEKKYLQRNAAIAIGNSHDRKYLPYLLEAIHLNDPMIRAYAVWAILQIDPINGKETCQLLLKDEVNEQVLQEMK